MKKILTIFLSLLAGAFLSASIFLWMASGEIYDYQDTFVEARDGPKIDVVLCLAGGKGRILAAVNVWQKLRMMGKDVHSPILFLSGVGPQVTVESLAEQGVSKEMLKVIKQEDVVIENVSTNTFENAQIFSSFLHQKKWQNVLLVTASYHMKRSRDILRKAVGPNVNIYSETVDAEHFDRQQWHKDAYAMRVTIVEYIKWLFYRYSY